MEQAKTGLKKKFPDRAAVAKKVSPSPYFPMTMEEFQHVIDGCESIVRFFTGEIPYPGDFITAVLKNDLHDAFARADEINIRCMWCYPAFIHNQIPIGLVHLGRELK
jgi:hypothetical protein